ncbi:MAG: hypothetical protein AB7R40_23230 [Nitrospiraceae bacterium]
MKAEFTEALVFAARAHQNQQYGDRPYIFHPMRVAELVMPEYRVVAVLHDCLEDAGRLPFWLSYPEKLAVHLLTREKKQPYAEYIDRIALATGWPGECARAVKLADIADHLSHSPIPSQETRYRKAMKQLQVV